MKKTFNLFFDRPEPYFGLQVEVPEWWDEVSYMEQVQWLDDYVNIHELRTVNLEDADEVVE